MTFDALTGVMDESMARKFDNLYEYVLLLHSMS